MARAAAWAATHCSRSAIPEPLVRGGRFPSVLFTVVDSRAAHGCDQAERLRSSQEAPKHAAISQSSRLRVARAVPWHLLRPTNGCPRAAPGSGASRRRPWWPTAAARARPRTRGHLQGRQLGSCAGPRAAPGSGSIGWAKSGPAPRPMRVARHPSFVTPLSAVTVGHPRVAAQGPALAASYKAVNSVVSRSPRGTQQRCYRRLPKIPVAYQMPLLPRRIS